MSELTDQVLKNQQKSYKQLVTDNLEAVNEYNARIISTLSLMGWVLLLLPLLVVPFSNTKKDVVPIYLFGITIYFVVFILLKFSIFKKYLMFYIYISFSVLFLLAIYLSVIHSPDMRATILLGAFCLMPLSFIDNPWRVNMFSGFWFLLHTVLAFNLKPKYALDDTINCLCFGILGCYLGYKVVKVRLDSFDVHRLLVIDRDTDALTKLKNRRKLFDTLALMEKKDVEKPSGFLMIDIDNFKEINDTYGHYVGDKCLKKIGETMINIMQDVRIQFYRYGGDEILAILFGYSEKEILSIAESLRTDIEEKNIERCGVTVSIGASYCGKDYIKNYEYSISRADKAVYSAKRNGRNKVCIM